MKRFSSVALGFAALFTLVLSTTAPAQQKVQVPFRFLPEAVQNRLVEEGSQLGVAETAAVYMSLQGGQVVYSGQLAGRDGSVQTIEIDENGGLIKTVTIPSPLENPINR